MIHDLEIDTDGVRACAAGITGLAARVGNGGTSMPPQVAGPRWNSTAAAATTATTAHDQLVRVGDDISATARQIIAAVLDYEAADERAADRVRGAER